MAKQTLTSRSLAILRKRGMAADISERWIPAPKPFRPTRKDLFGFADVVAIDSGGTQLVQVTSRGNVSARVKKIRETIEEAGWSDLFWNNPSVTIVVHGWYKKGHRWRLKEIVITDLDTVMVIS